MHRKGRQTGIKDDGGSDNRDLVEMRRRKFGLDIPAVRPIWPETMNYPKKELKRVREEVPKAARNQSTTFDYYKDIEERKRSHTFKEALSKAFGMKSEDNFVPRKEPDYLDPLIDIYKHIIHLYGVDFMDTGAINTYFSHFQPKEIAWVDASSANVSFDDEETAKRAFFANLRHQPPTKYEKYIRGETNPRFDPFEPRDPLIESEWMEMLPTYAFGVERRLFARFATSEDTNSMDPAEEIRSEKAMMLIRCMNLIHVDRAPPKRSPERERFSNDRRYPRHESRSISRNSSKDSTWSRSSTASTQEAFLRYVEEGRKRQHKG